MQIVKKMVQKHNLTVTIHGCPIHREANGLAMSSRNERLSADARNEASLIYKTLKEAKSKFENHSAKEVIAFVDQTPSENIRIFNWNILKLPTKQHYCPASEKAKAKKYRGFIAIFINNIRLIDNISLN